jgi:Domain of unknown function DUF29
VSDSKYEVDFYAWTQAQARALRADVLGEIDRDHLAEELDDLGRSVRRTIGSQLERVLVHLLKYTYDPTPEPRRQWRQSIRQAREAIDDELVESPSLQDYPAGRLPLAYRRARLNAADETGLPLTTFPETCPWAIAQVLQEDWWPEAQP